MFGSPLFSSLILLSLFGIGGSFALLKVTQAEAKKPEVIQTTEEHQERVMSWITVRSAHPLESATLTVKGSEVTLERLSEKEFEAELELPRIAPITLSAEWEEGSPESAILLSLEPEGLRQWSKTLWGQGSVRQEFSYSFYVLR